MTLKCHLNETDILKCSIKTGGAAAKTQSKTVTPSDTEQTVYPDAGYLLSSVKIEAMPAPQTQSKTVTSAVNQQTVTPDDGYLLSSVTVDGMPSETASVTPTESAQTVLPSEGKLLSEVAVGAIPSQYHDTSSANISAADVTQGKIAFGANGQIVGTNDYVKPSPAVTFEYDWAAIYNAYIINKVFVSYNGEPPSGYLSRFGNAYCFANGCELYFEPNVTAIPGNCCSYVDRISKVTIRGNLTRISMYAFGAASSIVSVIFEGNVERIEDKAFSSTTKLSLLDFSHATAITELGGSLSHKSGCVIRVPQSLLSDWQSAAGWRDLTDVVWEGV